MLLEYKKLLRRFYVHICSNLFSVSAYRVYLLLPLAHFMIAPVNEANQIRTRVGLDLNIVSYRQLAFTCRCAKT